MLILNQRQLQTASVNMLITTTGTGRTDRWAKPHRYEHSPTPRKETTSASCDEIDSAASSTNTHRPRSLTTVFGTHRASTGEAIPNATKETYR
jgi:hypothetical protein